MRAEFNNKMRELMNKAWMLVKKYGFTMSEAMKQAWALVKLVNKMRKGIVKFMYTKVDGSTRTAWGTLEASRMPATQGTGRKPNPSVQVYFDTEKEEYRCFKIANLVF